MSLQGWSETLITAQVAGPVLNTFTTAVSCLPPAARFTLPAGFFSIGKKLRIILDGNLSNIVTTPGTLTLSVQMGPTSNIAVFTSGAMNFSTTAHTTLPFHAEIALTCRSIGNGTVATLMGQGWITSQALANTSVADSVANSLPLLLMPNTAPAAGTGFDSTVSMPVDIFAALSISNAGNGITVQQYELSALN
jgi:hypothetical protein